MHVVGHARIVSNFASTWMKRIAWCDEARRSMDVVDEYKQEREVRSTRHVGGRNRSCPSKTGWTRCGSRYQGKRHGEEMHSYTHDNQERGARKNIYIHHPRNAWPKHGGAARETRFEALATAKAQRSSSNTKKKKDVDSARTHDARKDHGKDKQCGENNSRAKKGANARQRESDPPSGGQLHDDEKRVKDKATEASCQGGDKKYLPRIEDAARRRNQMARWSRHGSSNPIIVNESKRLENTRDGKRGFTWYLA